MHELICITEREKFIVPVRAIGARAILDFPDEVNFPPSPVKYSATKTLLVRNVGSRDAKFSLQTEKWANYFHIDQHHSFKDSSAHVLTWSPQIPFTILRNVLKYNMWVMNYV